MKIDGNEIRPGNVIEHQSRLWRAVRIQHVKPGKGGAYLQVELREVRDGTKLNERFRSAETVERVRLDQKDYQYLYSDGDQFTFMDQETYEQVTLDSSIIEPEQSQFLQDGMSVTIESYENSPIGVSLPEKVTLGVAEADAVVKGQTASSSYKPAVLENGIKIMVPPFINSDDKIILDTRTLEYIKKVK